MPGKHSALYPYPFEPHDMVAETTYLIRAEEFPEIKPYIVAWGCDCLGSP